MTQWTWIGGVGVLLAGGGVAAWAWRRHVRRKAMEETARKHLDTLDGAETEEEFNLAAVDAAGAMARQEIDSETLRQMARAPIVTMIEGLASSIVSLVQVAQLDNQLQEKFIETNKAADVAVVNTNTAVANTSTEAKIHTTTTTPATTTTLLTPVLSEMTI